MSQIDHVTVEVFFSDLKMIISNDPLSVYKQSSAAGPSTSSPQSMKDSKETSQTILDHIKPCWYWDKKDLAHTPSQSEGMDPGTEARYRREGARFIFDVGTRLGLYPWLVCLVNVTKRLWRWTGATCFNFSCLNAINVTKRCTLCRTYIYYNDV